MARGTNTVAAEEFKKLDCSLGFQPKTNNIVGVQIADLCAHPCARHILNPSRLNRAFDIAHRHIYNAVDTPAGKSFLKIKWAPPAFARERPPTEHSQSTKIIHPTLHECKRLCYHLSISVCASHRRAHFMSGQGEAFCLKTSISGWKQSFGTVPSSRRRAVMIANSSLRLEIRGFHGRGARLNHGTTRLVLRGLGFAVA
jgi:hypothetical protein